MYETTSQLAQSFATGPASSSSMDDRIKRLRLPNDLYFEYSPDWDDYLAAYEGGRSVLQARYLPKHARETNEDYEDRLKRLHYLNYCAPIVDFFTNFIFTETIHRSGGDDDAWYQEFIRDVNRKGEDITSFMSAVSDDMQIFGMSWQMVDTPSFASGELTLQQQNDAKIRPYWVLIKPSEMLDWVTDEFDKLVYARRQQFVEEANATSRRRIEKYTEFFPDRWVISKVDITDSSKPEFLGSEEIANPLNEIPLQVTRFKRSKKCGFMGNSFLRDFARNNIEVMGLTSLLQEFLYKIKGISRRQNAASNAESSKPSRSALRCGSSRIRLQALSAS